MGNCMFIKLLVLYWLIPECFTLNGGCHNFKFLDHKSSWHWVWWGNVLKRKFLLSGTSKWSKILLSGTLKWSKICLFGTPKWSKTSILKKIKNFWYFLKSKLFFKCFPTNPIAHWTYGQNFENCYTPHPSPPSPHPLNRFPNRELS